VVEKTGCEDGGVEEAERSFYAQAPDGTVCIYGEEGEWVAGEDGFEPAIFMPAAPEVGMVFEVIHGEDEVEVSEITEVGVPFETPAGLLEDTVTVLEEGPSTKRYARDIGEIYDDGIVLVSY
jgi:hypothetical protein